MCAYVCDYKIGTQFHFGFPSPQYFWPWSSQLGLWTFQSSAYLRRAVWVCQCCRIEAHRKLNIIESEVMPWSWTASNHLLSSNKTLSLNARTPHFVNFHLCFRNPDYLVESLKKANAKTTFKKSLGTYICKKVHSFTVCNWLYCCALGRQAQNQAEEILLK